MKKKSVLRHRYMQSERNPVQGNAVGSLEKTDTGKDMDKDRPRCLMKHSIQANDNYIAIGDQVLIMCLIFRTFKIPFSF